MQGKQFIHTLALRNFLSFGAEKQTIGLEPLNVVIGPNGSGKSNLIEAFAVLRDVTSDLKAVLQQGGGVHSWPWAGAKGDTVAEIEATLESPDGSSSLDYLLQFGGHGEHLFQIREEIKKGEQVLYRNDDPLAFQSILSNAEKLSLHPEFQIVADGFSSLRIYREWAFGPNSEARTPRTKNQSGAFLAEDASNLVNVVAGLGGTRYTILRYLKKIYEGADAFIINNTNDQLRLEVVEDLTMFIPAARLSSGTLRYLSLLTILCHPSPPPLICIEEPEIGLHPDLMSTIAELLIEAAQRTQLVVTTHSAELISRLWECPEAVVVCERDLDGSHLRRLDPVRLEKWLERYSLGELWLSGEIGGTRW
jgi:predicted ATPase